MPFLHKFSSRSINVATTIAADGSGIYVIGNLTGQFGGVRAGVRKYDSLGNELWTREFTVPGPASPQFARAAADGTGVYVVEWAGQMLRKYSPEGDELWTRQLEFRPLGGVTVHASGVYVAGRDFPPGGAQPPNPIYLRRYSAEGAEIWTRRWGEPSVMAIPLAVTQDSTGVYVLGLGESRKYDHAGNQLWNRRLSVQPSWQSVVAPAHPAGFFAVDGGNSNDSFLAKYDTDGNELWSRPLATPNTVYPGGITADPTGVYMAGTTDLAGPALPGQCRSGSAVDSFVRKYDLDGKELWTREFGTSEAAWASDVAVRGGDVYVAGRYGRAFEETAPPESGAFLAKFETSSLTVPTSRPRVFPDCIVNAASYVGGGVAPGEIVTLFGTSIGPSELVRARLNDEQRLPAALAETRVLFNGVPAPLLYVSDKQTSAIVPYASAGRTAVEVQVEYGGVLSNPVVVAVLDSRPGIFTVDGSGRGQGVILNEDGSLNSASNPARKGSVITIFGTGGGEAAPGVLDGQIVSNGVLRTNLPVSVVFDFGLDDEFGNGSKPGEVLNAGGSPGSIAGLLQVNVRVPANTMLTGDAAPFALIIGSERTVYQATVAIR